MKPSQLKIIKNKIDKTGMISRNWCLRRYISRLSARILDLKKQGYQFVKSHYKGDYIYTRV